MPRFLSAGFMVNVEVDCLKFLIVADCLGVKL